jgi:hypothetical protein
VLVDSTFQNVATAIGGASTANQIVLDRVIFNNVNNRIGGLPSGLTRSWYQVLGGHMIAYATTMIYCLAGCRV